MKNRQRRVSQQMKQHRRCRWNHGRELHAGSFKSFVTASPAEVDEASPADASEERSGTSRYRTQRRGGKGLRDIKTTRRNGKVVGIVRVDEEDELLMMTAGGMIQRIAVKEVSVVGRNTQGVRIMKLKDGDALTAIVRVPREESAETLAASAAVSQGDMQTRGDGENPGGEAQ